MQTQANAGTGGISTANKNALANIASNTCAALGDSIPQVYLNLGTFSNVTYPPGLTGIINTKANLYLGSPTGLSTNWDLSRFAQILAACVAYEQLANQLAAQGGFGFGKSMADQMLKQVQAAKLITSGANAVKQ